MTTILVTGSGKIICRPCWFTLALGQEPHVWCVRPSWWRQWVGLSGRG